MWMASVEARPWEVCASSVFTSGGETDIRLCVVVNSLLPIDGNELAREVVKEHLKINDQEKKPGMSWNCTGPVSIIGGIVPGM